MIISEIKKTCCHSKKYFYIYFERKNTTIFMLTE